MTLVNCAECGNDVSERAAPARSRQSRKTHPIRWVAVATIISLLVWDVQATLRESQSHNVSGGASLLHIGIRR
jgi:hypothetical protein